MPLETHTLCILQAALPRPACPPTCLGQWVSAGQRPEQPNQPWQNRTNTTANGMTRVKPRSKFPGARTWKGLNLGEIWMCVPFQPLVDSGPRHTFHCSLGFGPHTLKPAAFQTLLLADEPVSSRPIQGRGGQGATQTLAD